MSPEVNPKRKLSPEYQTSLLPTEIRATLPTIESLGEDVLDSIAQVKFIAPKAPSWALYVAAFDGEDTLFGLSVSFYDVGLGTYSLSGCERAGQQIDTPIRRDETFQPTTLGQLKQRHEERINQAFGDSVNSQNDLETLLTQKAELLSLWRHFPPERQAELALELLDTETVSEWTPWLRDQITQYWQQEIAPLSGTYLFPEVTRAQLRLAGWSEDDIAELSDTGLSDLRHSIYEDFVLHGLTAALRKYARPSLGQSEEKPKLKPNLSNTSYDDE